MGLHRLKVEDVEFHGTGGVCPYFDVTAIDVRTGASLRLHYSDDTGKAPFKRQLIRVFMTAKAFRRVRDGRFKPNLQNSLWQMLKGFTVLHSQPQPKIRIAPETIAA